MCFFSFEKMRALGYSLHFRGPHGMKQSEPGQDRNVAALRMSFYALRQSPVFLFPFSFFPLRQRKEFRLRRTFFYQGF